MGGVGGVFFSFYGSVGRFVGRNMMRRARNDVENKMLQAR